MSRQHDATMMRPKHTRLGTSSTKSSVRRAAPVHSWGPVESGSPLDRGRSRLAPPPPLPFSPFYTIKGNSRTGAASPLASTRARHSLRHSPTTRPLTSLSPALTTRPRLAPLSLPPHPSLSHPPPLLPRPPLAPHSLPSRSPRSPTRSPLALRSRPHSPSSRPESVGLPPRPQLAPLVRRPGNWGVNPSTHIWRFPCPAHPFLLKRTFLLDRRSAHIWTTGATSSLCRPAYRTRC